MDYETKRSVNASKTDGLDEAMANYFSENVQELKLKQISNEVESPKDSSENDKTCSSIFSCNLFAKSSSDSQNSGAKNLSDKNRQGNVNEEQILGEQAPRTLAMICDVIGCDQIDQSNELNRSNKKDFNEDSSPQTNNQQSILNGQQIPNFNSMSLFAYPNHDATSDCFSTRTDDKSTGSNQFMA
jgi:hypothetical protein